MMLLGFVIGTAFGCFLTHYMHEESRRIDALFERMDRTIERLLSKREQS